ncbi:MAG: Ig-like domain-containing protein, partial [Promethearchaeia archaeon]
MTPKLDSSTDQYKNGLSPDDKNTEHSTSPITGEGTPQTGYSTVNVSRFDTLEETSSRLGRRGFIANGTNPFNLSTPEEWNLRSLDLGLESYHKKQIIKNSSFNSEDYWDHDDSANAQGTIKNDFEPENNPEYAKTNLYHTEPFIDQMAFLKGDYGIFQQSIEDLNPRDLEIAHGELFQEKDQSLFFKDFQYSADHLKDLNNPYGGDQNTGDEVNLNHFTDEDGYLRVNINPGTGEFRGNPSAAWWRTVNLPYEVDYAQVTITWEIDPQSNFEPIDDYRVCARVNNKYIDGVNDLVSGNSVPGNGSDRALLVYNESETITNELVTRTFNITRQIDGLVGANKFDFGAWAKNPSKTDEDRIVVDFHSVELMYNVSNKYEIGEIEFDYKAINNMEESLISSDGNQYSDPNRIVNNASIYLIINNGSQTEHLRMIPFTQLNPSSESAGDTSWSHKVYSIPQEYSSLLRSETLNVGFGVVFETNYDDPIDLDLYYDNFSLNINYKHPDVNYSELEIKVDGNPWYNATSENEVIDISGWTPGTNHSVQFRTQNVTFRNKLFLNIMSNLQLNLSRYGLNGAKAKYIINAATDSYGYWNITYNNTLSYSKLSVLNVTPFFNVSQYNISYIDLPAFDELGAKSDNWEVLNAYSPLGEDFTYYLSTFNYSDNKFNQSSKIKRTFRSGIWSVIARQENYITGHKFNGSTTYNGAPVFYRDSFLNYNFTLKEDALMDYNGYYNVSIFQNETLVSSFPKYYSSSSNNLTGTLELSAQEYEVGLYYFSIRWNDSDTSTMQTLRFGSDFVKFYIANATVAQFISTDTTVDSGNLANFSAYYRADYNGGWGINTTNVFVYETNSSPDGRLWGRAWSGSYQVSTEYLGDGNYSFQLDTRGAPIGKYNLLFKFNKLGNQKQNLTIQLEITAPQGSLKLDILVGAYKNSGDWVLNNSNIPYVNDTINSVLKFNLTQQSGDAISDGTILGAIGTEGKYSEAVNLGDGEYNLTLDTTGLNATGLDSSETLHITYSADGYETGEMNVTVFIKKIPTAITLHQIESAYENGEATITAIMNNYITPDDPEPNNGATLTYNIYNGSQLIMEGYLDFFSNGVYTKDITLQEILAGEYMVFVNGSAFNCQSSISINRSLIIESQLLTNLEIEVPLEIRILKQFEIKNTLLYENGTAIPDQTIYLNITIAGESSIITTETDQDGISTYQYIVSADDEGEDIQINATYQGQEQIGSATAGINQTIQGKFPVFLDIIDNPNNTTRVGYSATYRVAINITDPEISNQQKSVLLTAYYDGDIANVFVSTQLTTDSNGECEYTIESIANHKKNVTVFFEYLGSDTVAYGSVNRTDDIAPKWPVNLILDELPEVIRFGQLLTFDMAFWSPENASLDFSGLRVAFKFEYGAIVETYDDYVGKNNSLIFQYQIADNFNGPLNITITFTGNTKMAANSTFISRTLSEKIKLKLQFEGNIQSQYYTGTHLVSVKLTDEEDNPIQGLNLLIQILDSNGKVVYNASAETNENGIASTSIKFTEIGDNYKLRVSFIEEGIYAGSVIEQEEIRVVNEFIVFLDMLPFILLGVAIISAVSYAYYRGYVIPKRRKRREALKQLYQKLEDVENIQYLLIITKYGGVPVFSKSLADVPIDESLVSGFLSAISSFGAEIGSKMKKEKTTGGLEEASYR